MYTADQLTNTVNALTKEEQEALFAILTENIDIFSKILPNIPLINYILHGGHECSVLGECYAAWTSAQ
jgi:hypothetical protein